MAMSDVRIFNCPILSIFPLLAYHKICNDHYRNEKWQPFEPWTCNIDYLTPDANMNAKEFISDSLFTHLQTSIIDLENSNLPIDYFTSVLPRAQYGDESAVPIGLKETDAHLTWFDGKDKGFLFGGNKLEFQDYLRKSNGTPGFDSSVNQYVSQFITNSNTTVHGIHGVVIVTGKQIGRAHV